MTDTERIIVCTEEGREGERVYVQRTESCCAPPTCPAYLPYGGTLPLAPLGGPTRRGSRSGSSGGGASLPLLSALSLGASREALNNENKCTRHSQQQTMFAVLTTFPLTVLLWCWLWWEESSLVGRHWTLAPCPEGRVAERGLGRPCMGAAWGELDKAGHTQHSHTHKYAHTNIHTASLNPYHTHTGVAH